MKEYWNSPRFYGIAVFGILFFRGIFNSILPLFDGIEAHHAEMARIMMENHSWSTLSIDTDVSFLVQIPLFIKLTAFSLELFGVYEFAARFPSFLVAISFVFLLGKYGKRNGVPFFLPGFILCTIPEFLIHAGIVTSDLMLAFCIALTVLSFWEAIQDQVKWYWKFLIVIGLGIGFLTKGFIAVALTIPPIIAWCICFRKTTCILKRIPFIIGVVLIFSSSTLWYALTTEMTPKQEDDPWYALGIFCGIVLVLSIFWIPVILCKIRKDGEILRANKWLMFLLFWLLWTPIVFVFSENLIDSYILFLIVPITLLITDWIPSLKHKETLIKTATTIPVFLLFLTVVGMCLGHIQYFAPSDKYLIQNSVQVGHKIYHLHSGSYSSQFYSKGVIEVITIDELEDKIKANTHSFRVLIQDEIFEKIGLEKRKKLQHLARNYNKGVYGVYKE